MLRSRLIMPISALLLGGVLAWAASPARAQTAPDCAGNTNPCSNCDNLTNALYSGACTIAPDVYSFTIKEMRLRKTDGTFVSIATGDTTFNAASVTAGAQIGSYVNGATVLPASYDAMSPILDKDWGFSASTTGGAAGSCATTAAGFSTNTANQATRIFDLVSFFTNNPGNAPSDIIISGNTMIVVDTNPALQVTVNNGQSLAVNISFDAATGAQFVYAGGVCQNAILGELGVTVSMTVN